MPILNSPNTDEKSKAGNNQIDNLSGRINNDPAFFNLLFNSAR